MRLVLNDLHYPMARLAIVEDQSLLLSLLHDLCERVFGHEVAVTASSRAELLHALTQTTIDVVLLDLNLPDANGIDLARELPALAPQARILAVSGEITPYILHQALEARIHGFVDKDSDPKVLREAIETVHRGEPFFSDFVTETSRRQLGASDSFVKVLSQTEVSLMPLFGQGLHNDVIARQRGLSAATVQTHRRNIMSKLGLHSSIDLMNYAIKSGFVMVRIG